MPGTENSARDVRPAQARAPRILCDGIIVLDEVFYVENLPPSDGKVEAKEFFIVNGGYWRRSRARRSTARPVSAFPDWRRRCRRSSSTRAATAPS
jgi:hypothetical protein